MKSLNRLVIVALSFVLLSGATQVFAQTNPKFHRPNGPADPNPTGIGGRSSAPVADVAVLRDFRLAGCDS